MNQDIDSVLEDWEYKPGTVQARLVTTRSGREVIQMRVELGLLQLETTGRPDGARPHGQRTYLDHLQKVARKAAARGDGPVVLAEEQCQEADREFIQFYHRRICWLALRQYAKAMRDADHTLAFMDFVKEHSPAADYTEAHEQYRGFVVFQRTQAASALQVEENHPEQAIEEVRQGMERLRAFLVERGQEEQLDEDAMIQHLRRIETALREQFHIGATLQEQLEEAVAREDYERAAKLRDALKKRQ